MDKNYINKVCKRYLNRDAGLDKQFEEVIDIIIENKQLCSTKTIIKKLYQEKDCNRWKIYVFNRSFS